MKNDKLGMCGWMASLKWRRALPIRPAAAALAVLFSAWLCPTLAAPITAVQAAAAVNAWLAADSTPMNSSLSQTIGDAMAYPGSDGTNAFYVVSLLPEGYVIVAADSMAGSVISFSSK